MARKEADLHVRITKEEKEFLKEMRIHQSKLVRSAINEEMRKLPIKLEKRKQKLRQEIEEIEKQLQKVSQRTAKKQKFLKHIADEFVKFDRHRYSDEQNIQWLNRFKDEIKERDIELGIRELIDYCYKHRDEVGKYE